MSNMCVYMIILKFFYRDDHFGNFSDSLTKLEKLRTEFQKAQTNMVQRNYNLESWYCKGLLSSEMAMKVQHVVKCCTGVDRFYGLKMLYR